MLRSCVLARAPRSCAALVCCARAPRSAALRSSFAQLNQRPCECVLAPTVGVVSFAQLTCRPDQSRRHTVAQWIDCSLFDPRLSMFIPCSVAFRVAAPRVITRARPRHPYDRGAQGGRGAGRARARHARAARRRRGTCGTISRATIARRGASRRSGSSRLPPTAAHLSANRSRALLSLDRRRVSRRPRDGPQAHRRRRQRPRRRRASELARRERGAGRARRRGARVVPHVQDGRGQRRALPPRPAPPACHTSGA